MKYSNVKFELNQKQIDKLNEWWIEVEKKAAVAQAVKIARGESPAWLRDHGLPFYGCGAEGLIFTFTETVFGFTCEVTEPITNEAVNLTDLDDWG